MEGRIAIFPMRLPGIYFDSVLICWFVAAGKRHGLWPSLQGFSAISKLFLRVFLFGFVPGAILTQVAWFLFPSLGYESLMPVLVGTLISSIILHHHVLSMVISKKKWNIAIGTLCMLIAALFYFALFALEGQK